MCGGGGGAIRAVIVIALLLGCLECLESSTRPLLPQRSALQMERTIYLRKHAVTLSAFARFVKARKTLSSSDEQRTVRLFLSPPRRLIMLYEDMNDHKHEQSRLKVLTPLSHTILAKDVGGANSTRHLNLPSQSTWRGKVISTTDRRTTPRTSVDVDLIAPKWPKSR